MTSRRVDRENPDRLYTVTGGRSRADENAMDMVTLIVSECDPTPGLQSEHFKILQMCRHPMAVVEISSELGLPVSVVRILLCDLLDTGRITARHPPSALPKAQLPDPEILKQVLVGLQKL
ncbi:DUF742 domain-containing protein [Streptosporangium sp. NBC_01639]|uniref:DUF742 domain-containing protein n=1 Tax=unclassified Streptosporangium TaxID=2632669 RepID=UPI002DDC140C|nr:DUF742 domain-containing protein [Streptosporangium sp. NBC_01756]WSC89535.1 DUF742 domain-containing protein [Streptosporangium sp. NBC_01756]WTD51793.1 DUF742 domain-containing protein [Streptosporangium sp. NBC_01639]